MREKVIMHIAEAPGGVERYLHTILTEFKKYKDFKHILVCSKAYDIGKFEGLVYCVEIIDCLRNPINLNNDFHSAVRIRKLIKKHHPDIVYCHSSKAGALGRIANIFINNKTIYNAHGWAFNMKMVSQRKVKLYELIERLLSPLADKIICISEYERISAITHHICKENKLVVINNGINLDEYKYINESKINNISIPNGAFVIGTVGRLCNQKASDIFVKMADVVKKEIPNAFFLMVGDDIGSGNVRKEIEKQIKDCNLLDSFCITGWVNDPLEYVQHFDVACLLSRWEGFGLVIPEYMMMKKPIVATNVDAIPYVMENSGILVEVDDYNAAAKAVVNIFRDHKLQDELVGNGQIILERYSVSRTVREHIKLFSSLFSK